MEVIEIKRAIMSFIGSLADKDFKINDYVFNESIAERTKDVYNLDHRKKEYEALVWAKENPDFDFRTIIPDDPNYKIPFSKKEVYDLLMRLKDFYEVEEYELLTDDRKPKEGWEL